MENNKVTFATQEELKNSEQLKNFDIKKITHKTIKKWKKQISIKILMVTAKKHSAFTNLYSVLSFHTSVALAKYPKMNLIK